jgi:hypothetical protein
MTLYLDTEFNGHAGELISLALVSNKSPDEFYGVLPLPDPVHPWVAAHVVPILDRKPDEPAVFRTRLRFFLEKHSGQEIVADWPDDFTHLMKALSGNSYGESWMIPMDMRLIVSGDVRPEQPHNALSDARALMYWHSANPV